MASLPFVSERLYTRVSEAPGRHDARRSRREEDSSRRARSLRPRQALRTAEPPFARRRRRAPVAHAGSCQAEIAVLTSRFCFLGCVGVPPSLPPARVQSASAFFIVATLRARSASSCSAEWIRALSSRPPNVRSRAGRDCDERL